MKHGTLEDQVFFVIHTAGAMVAKAPGTTHAVETGAFAAIYISVMSTAHNWQVVQAAHARRKRRNRRTLLAEASR